MLEVAVPRELAPERAYACDVVLREFLGLDYRLAVADRRDVCLTLTGDADGARLVVADEFFALARERWLAPRSLPQLPLDVWDPGRSPVEQAAQGLPVVWGRRLDGEYVQASGSELRLGLDVFGTAFFFLSRYEERVLRERDEHGRFPAGSSLPARAGLCRRPLLDEYVMLLADCLTRLWPRVQVPHPCRRVWITHDVDHPGVTWGASVAETLRRTGGDLVKRHSPGLAAGRVRAHLRSRAGDVTADPAYTFDLLMDASEQLGVRSSFNFLAGDPPGRYDGRYSLRDGWVGPLFRRIHARGHAIGFHGSYDGYLDPARTAAEFELLVRSAAAQGIRQESWGGRQHFLRWRAPDTWQCWEDAGLACDSTLGYADRVGFRCATSRSFPVFNIETRRALRLRELPLTVMDVALAREAARTGEDPLEVVAQLDAACRSVGGTFVLLWHNSELLTRRQKRFYAALLDVLR